jgi:hypothetical protein
VSDWTVQTLKDYVDAIFREKDKALDAALKSQQDLAEKHNDLIRTGEKDREKFVTRTELIGAMTVVLLATGVIVSIVALVIHH